MKTKSLIYNARIHTQSHGQICDSMAICKGRIVAVGNNLRLDPDFKSYDGIDLNGRFVCPGFVDAHAHFHYYALSLGRVSLHGLDSLGKCLEAIKKYAVGLNKNEWIVGEGYSPDRFKTRLEPDRWMLDEISGGRPAFIFSKDQHSAWVNSRALELAGITARTKEPAGGAIVRASDGQPTGILREKAAYHPVFQRIKPFSEAKVDRLYNRALKIAYSRGVTGIHSFDGPEGFEFFLRRLEENKLGLRIDYYPGADLLPALQENKVYYGQGNSFFRVAGIKIFADGALGSQTALCFNKYIGSSDNFGIEVTALDKMKRQLKSARRLGLPAAIHAIGDRAVANVLEAFESVPMPDFNARNRVEHLQLIRRKDIKRLKSLNAVASMQPSHCPSDIDMIEKYWGKRGSNAFVFRTLLDSGIDLAFGSDCPIEPLNPIEGIAAAVRRTRPGSRKVFYQEQRITAEEAVFGFTVGAARASGQEHCRGYLLPGYPADFVVLSDDITKVASTRIQNVAVMATVLDGKVKYSDGKLSQ